MLYQWYHLWKWNIVFVVKLKTLIVINLFIHSKSRTSWLRLQKSSKGKSPFREINAFTELTRFLFAKVLHLFAKVFIREYFALYCKIFALYRESEALIAKVTLFIFARVLFYRESRVIISKSFAFIRDKLMFLPSKS